MRIFIELFKSFPRHIHDIWHSDWWSQYESSKDLTPKLFFLAFNAQLTGILRSTSGAKYPCEADCYG